METKDIVILIPKLSSNCFLVLTASKMRWRSRVRVGLFLQVSIRLKMLSSFWMRHSMKRVAARKDSVLQSFA